MLRVLAAVLVALLASPAFAGTTWSAEKLVTARVSKAVCTTGTEVAPSNPAAGVEPKEGLALHGMTGFAVHAEAAAAMTAGGKLLAYGYNPVTRRWLPVPDLDITVAALQYQGFAGFIVTADVGRIAYVPSGVGQAVTVYIVGTPKRS